MKKKVLEQAICNVSGEVVEINPGNRTIEPLIPVTCLNTLCRLRPFCEGGALVIGLPVPPQQPEGTGAQPARITPEVFRLVQYEASRDAGGSYIAPSRLGCRP